MLYLLGFAVISALVGVWALCSLWGDLEYSPLGRPDVAD
jgi:hypothetical protein